MANIDKKEMVQLFQKELELCEVKRNETVSIVSNGDHLRDYAMAFLDAAHNIGVRAVDVHLPAASGSLANFGRNDLANHPKAMEILKSSDLVIDLLVVSFSKEQEELQNAGARILLVCEEFETLKRLFPTAEHRARTERSLKRLRNAKTFRFANHAGTEVTYRFGNRYKPLIEYGFVAERGRWDHFPAGLVANCADHVSGRVVMDEGDIIYPTMKFLGERITFDIENSHVTRISGGKEADELRRWMDTYDDPRAYDVSHIGWGTHAGAQWSVQGIGMDGRSYYGNVLFSLGPNLEFGGDNDTACHVDLPMRGCTAWVDDEKIIANGRLLPEDLKSPHL